MQILARLALLVFVALFLYPLAGIAQDEVAAGKKVFRKCQACHSVEAGVNKVGPSLAGVLGRKAGSVEKYNYSRPMKEAAFAWDEAALDAFLADPAKHVPGNKMTFVGLKSTEDRAAVIAFLKSTGQSTAAEAPAPSTSTTTTGDAAAHGDHQPAPQPTPPAEGPITGGYVPNVKYTLRSGIAEGRMVFVGFGGSIDGVVNPELTANEGDVVQVTLINGEGAEHDIVFEQPAIMSQHVVGKGASTTVAFRAGTPGTSSYFCSLPGHRQAGMEGKFTVKAKVPEAAVAAAPTIALDPAQVPPPIGNRAPTRVKVELETVELEGQLADGTTYQYWTFNGTVPGPFIRVRVGDTVEVSIKNDPNSAMIHSVDFHAATGPGGGAAYLQVDPGQTKKLDFKALVPGIYVYHCATPMVAHHIANGMYGLILVEPEGGLPPVDREFYVMQGEIYTGAPFGQQGSQEFSVEKMLAEQPEYVVFNGAVGALTKQFPMHAKVGETVRIYIGVGGPNLTSSFHVIGEIFDRVYAWGDLLSQPARGIQTVSVPAGGAVVTDFKIDVPGRFLLVDHALSRAERGLMGFLIGEGDKVPEIFKPYSEDEGPGH
jgi:nitrite reductase (NO-forming)